MELARGLLLPTMDNNGPMTTPSSELGKKSKAETLVGYFVGLVAAVLAGYGAYQGAIQLKRYLLSPSKEQELAVLHDALVKKLPELKANLPQRVDDATTLVDVKIDVITTVYVYSIGEQYEIGNMNDITERVTSKVCASQKMHAAIKDGFSYRYEYWKAGDTIRPIGSFTVSSCQ